MFIRIIADIFLFLGIFIFPFWLVFIFGLIFSFFFKNFYEFLIASVLLDVFYGGAKNLTYMIPFALSLVSLILYLIITWLKDRLLLY